MRRSLALVVVAACAAQSLPQARYDGKPTFPLDDVMTFPLVRPLDGGVLVTPVRVGDKGYFLFELDPFAPQTTIDGDLVSHRDDDDTGRIELGLGKITQTVDAQLIDARDIDRGGLDVWGVIGNDILREDMVFGVDRGAGYAWLASDAAFHRPATGEDYLSLGGGARVLAQVGSDLRYLRIAFTSRHHALQLAKWPARRDDDPLDGTSSITVPSVTALGHQVGPIALDDYTYGDADGVLGMAFFAPYDFAIDRGQHLFYFAPHAGRAPSRRIARWGPTPCPDLGCVSLETVDHDGHPGIRVTRDPAAAHLALEVTLAVVGVADAPLFVVNLPADVRAWTVPADARYLDHRFEVVDMSPFPPPCEERTGDKCVSVHEIVVASR